MSEIKTGLWQSTLDGSFIKVRRSGKIGVYYNDEGCDIEHVMSQKEFNHCYILVNADKPAPVIDDTFNDDTPAQTFSEVQKLSAKQKRNVNFDAYQLISDSTPAKTYGPVSIRTAAWDMGTDEKTVKVAVCLTCDAKMPEGSLAFDALNQGLGCMDCNANAGKMRLIGIAGQARAGKDTLASYMLDNLDSDWSRSSFADPLKAMLTAIDIDCSDEAKDLPSNQYGVSTRKMLQTLGTEWGREGVGSNFWVDVFKRMNAGKCVIVPDVRFENEADLVREHGILIHLVGRGGIEGNHVSENAIDFKPGDIVIDNSRDLVWLHGQVDGNAVLSEFIGEQS